MVVRLKVKDHYGRYCNSHLFIHLVESRHDPILKNDFRIMGKGYRNNTRRRKITEGVFIKKMKPSLDIYKKSVSYLTKVSEALFSEGLCYIEPSHLICIVYQLAGFTT